MTYHAHVEHGTLVLDTPVTLREGARYSLRPLKPRRNAGRKPSAPRKEPAWMALVGTLPKEAQDELSRIADEIVHHRRIDAETWA